MNTIARKELVEALRDHRALLSSLFYCLMGPAVVWMVSLALRGKDTVVLPGMISVFILVSAFSGGMSVAMDVMAGERERRSLLPLLGNPIPRSHIVLGKWLAVTALSFTGLLLCLTAFSIVYAPGSLTAFILILFTGLIPLSMLAAAVEIAVSTLCRNIKEAHTYLSLLIFLPMVLGMAGVFFPKATSTWFPFLPVAGNQYQIERWLRDEPISLFPSLLLGAMTLALAAGVLLATSELLERDHVVYGG